MGQARNRGTFEQRKAVALAEAKARAVRLLIEDDAYAEDRRRVPVETFSPTGYRSQRGKIALALMLAALGQAGVVQ